MMDMTHRFSLFDALHEVVKREQVTIRQFVIQHGLNEHVVGALSQRKYGSDASCVSSIELVLNACGYTLTEWDPRITEENVVGGVQAIEAAEQAGVPPLAMARMLGFPNACTMMRSRNYVTGGRWKRCSVATALRFYAALEDGFSDACREIIAQVGDDPPTAKHWVPPKPPEEETMQEKLYRVGRTFGFLQEDLEHAVFKEDRLEWYSETKKYRYEVTLDGFTAYWTNTGRVSVQRAYKRRTRGNDGV